MKSIADKLSEYHKNIKSLEYEIETIRRKSVPDISNPWGFLTNKNIRTLETDVEGTNPLFVSGGRLFQMNCGYCSATVEMRRRGFDVVANGLDGMFVSDWKKIFEGFETHHVNAKRKVSALVELKESIKDYGEGARGGIFVQWQKASIGHFFNFEVSNGNVIFEDGQSGFTGSTVEEYFDRVKPSSIIYGRWDNLDPNSDWITKACKNREGE